MAAFSVINIGIAGTSSIGAKVIPALVDCPNINVVGVGSRSVERADEYCKLHHAGVGMTYEELLSRPDVDAIYCPFATAHREEFLARIIQAGKHVYSEKPHGGTVQDLKSLIDRCAAARLQWMDGTMWYHSTRTQEIEERLRSGELGAVRRVTASFSWQAPDEDWLNGGNNRTNTDKEPHGMLGDSGHYPISAILWAFGWELPERVQALYTRLNSVGAIIEFEGALYFSGGRRAIFDTSAMLPHRSQFELTTDKAVIKVDDLVGGQGRSGNFAAYEMPFVGSGSYVLGDSSGKDELVAVKPCDHVQCLVQDFVQGVLACKNGGTPNYDWLHRSLATHTVMCALFESSQKGGAVVTL